MVIDSTREGLALLVRRLAVVGPTVNALRHPEPSSFSVLHDTVRLQLDRKMVALFFRL